MQLSDVHTVALLPLFPIRTLGEYEFVHPLLDPITVTLTDPVEAMFVRTALEIVA